MIYSIGRGMKRIDVPENHAKNNLPIGTVLQLDGYDNPSYVIVENQGITEGFSAYGTHYKTICLGTGKESIHDSLGMDHISKRDVEIKGIHMYFTDKVLSADEIMDAIKKSEASKAADIKEKHEKEQARAAELEKLLADYKHLERVVAYKDQKGRYRTKYAVGAANIRMELKAAFPGVKFSVRSEGYSMGCSIDIDWTDGPTKEAVKMITNKYEYGTFDSMTDCAGSIDSQFVDLFGGARHVSENRSTTKEVIK